MIELTKHKLSFMPMENIESLIVGDLVDVMTPPLEYKVRQMSHKELLKLIKKCPYSRLFGQLKTVVNKRSYPFTRAREEIFNMIQAAPVFDDDLSVVSEGEDIAELNS